jgi:tetraacyldisaccharide 4'-kinase
VVVDAVRGFGNGWLLPAGPLREPAVRLRSADAVVLTDRGNGLVRAQVPPGPLVAVAHFATGMAVRLRDSVRRPLAELRGRRIAAVAGIGQPAAFFAALRAAGLEIDEYPLGDHAALEAGRLPFAPDATVLMTEKDAVKCGGIAGEDWWYAELEVRLEPGEGRALVDLVLGHTAWADAGENRG